MIERYLESVNKFLEGKWLSVSWEAAPRLEPHVGLEFEKGGRQGLHALSSGERQIVTLIYAATHMSDQQVVLIDEPEIFAHVDWQRRLLKKMSKSAWRQANHRLYPLACHWCRL